MRVCVAIFYQDNGKKLVDIAKGLVKGIEANGHQVELIDGVKDKGKKISFYDYIALGTNAVSTMGGKIPPSVSEFLGQCGNMQGKRSFAFIHKGGLRKNKTLKALMSNMEHEGMFIKNSQILVNSQEATAIGKRLHIG